MLQREEEKIVKLEKKESEEEQRRQRHRQHPAQFQEKGTPMVGSRNPKVAKKLVGRLYPSIIHPHKG